MSNTVDAVTLFPELPTSDKRKRKKARSAQVFKPYHQEQTMFLPPSLEEMIPAQDVVRVVSRLIDGLDGSVLQRTYKGSGTSAFDPKMLLKVLVYAYVTKVYSSRRIAKALRQDIHFLWLSGMSRVDFRTINEFRSSRLKPVINQVFGATVEFLIEKQYVDLRQYFVDGTKIQADNNRHKIVWAKNTKRYRTKVQEKIAAQLAYIEQVNVQENVDYGNRDLSETGEASSLTSESVNEQITKLNTALQQEPATPQEQQAHRQTKKAVKEIEKHLLPKLEKYERQAQTLHGRNSYGKTDTDATCFRMKDGQLLPAYNVLFGTQNQFILTYSLHQQKASESDALISHMERFKNIVKRTPTDLMGDSAFGSQENYAYLEEKRIGNYLKYNTFHHEQTKKFKSNRYRKENFLYDASTDTYRCPEGRTLEFRENGKRTTASGYETTHRLYAGRECEACPVAMHCKKGEGARTVQRNETLDDYRRQARANLTSERGIALRKQRNIDVEPTIGDLKFNQAYTRCRLRGNEKVIIDLAILSIAHNAKKIALKPN